jgi:ribosomal protein S18 acetylase RimI-like enzyme
MDVEIRNAENRDLDRLVDLLEELFSIEADFSVDKDRQRRGLTLMVDGCGKHRCVKVADTGGRVVGMATAQLMVSTAEGAFSALVEDVVVTESMRGRGIGEALLDALEAWARQHGAARLQLLADRQNRPALDFYQRRGWVVTQLICLRKAPE